MSPLVARRLGLGSAEAKLDAVLAVMRRGGIAEVQQLLGTRIPAAVFYAALRRLSGPRTITAADAARTVTVEEAQVERFLIASGGNR